MYPASSGQASIAEEHETDDEDGDGTEEGSVHVIFTDESRAQAAMTSGASTSDVTSGRDPRAVMARTPSQRSGITRTASMRAVDRIMAMVDDAVPTSSAAIAARVLSRMPSRTGGSFASMPAAPSLASFMGAANISIASGNTPGSSNRSSRATTPGSGQGRRAVAKTISPMAAVAIAAGSMHSSSLMRGDSVLTPSGDLRAEGVAVNLAARLSPEEIRLARTQAVKESIRRSGGPALSGRYRRG